ncbi:MAG: DUF2489 domain-containing protein [Moraxellaceae bacterium]|nr:DUF2489 domain-containing protein [Moraxellaceae bacterium]
MESGVVFYMLGTLAIAVVLGLASYAIHLHIKLREREQAKPVVVTDAGGISCEQRHAMRRANLIEQLERLAMAALNDDVNISEITIRSRYLLDHLDPEQHMRERFEGIYLHYEAVKDFAVKEARDELTPAERRQEDIERLRAERENGEQVKLALQELLKLRDISALN